MSSTIRSRDRRRGAVMVEFALSFVLFFMVFVGAVEFARAVWTYSTVTHAARQAARFAMTRGTVGAATDAQIRGVVVRNAVGLAGDSLTVNVNWSSRERGGLAAVNVRYPFRLIAGPLLGSTGMRIESTAQTIVHQ